MNDINTENDWLYTVSGLTLFLKQMRGSAVAPGNMSWAIWGIPVNVFSTIRAISLQARTQHTHCLKPLIKDTPNKLTSLLQIRTISLEGQISSQGLKISLHINYKSKEAAVLTGLCVQ